MSLLQKEKNTLRQAQASSVSGDGIYLEIIIVSSVHAEPVEA